MCLKFSSTKMSIADIKKNSKRFGCNQSEKITSINFNCRCHLLNNSFFKYLKKIHWPIHHFNPFKLFERALLMKPPLRIVSFEQNDLEFLL